jgi:type VI secretion system protein ImpK
MPQPALSVEVGTAVGRFRRFYDELFTVKRLLHEGDWAALLGHRAAAGAMEEQVLLAVRMRLRSAIVSQGFGGSGSRQAPTGVDCGYVWTAVADAVLLHDVSWPGREGWAETPLEVVLYRSRIAGDRIFEAVEDLTRRHGRDQDGLAVTILLALEIGFRGRFHGIDDHGEIDRLKRRLFEMVFQAPSLEDFGGLTAGAVDALGANLAARLPSVRPWRLAILGVAAGYLLLSGLIWWNQVADIVDKARDAASSLSLSG